jgi:hypothetical protein
MASAGTFKKLAELKVMRRAVRSRLKSRKPLCDGHSQHGRSGNVMDRTAIYDELRQLERDAVEGERRLAEQEVLIVELKRQHQETAKAEAELDELRTEQRRRDQDRQRLLSRLQP